MMPEFPPAAPLQVEVCVQDALADLSLSDPSSAPQPSRSWAGAIAETTWEDWFQNWLLQLQPNLSPVHAYELTLRLTDDTEIQSLNAQYRQQDKPTDVLAFAALEVETPLPDEAQALLPLYLGDIIISIDTARRQAQAQGHAIETELAWLAAHGLLHLLGWDHPNDADLQRMLNQQQVLLNTVGLAVQTG
jgi:probable rRNA maturation factor